VPVDRFFLGFGFNAAFFAFGHYYALLGCSIRYAFAFHEEFSNKRASDSVQLMIAKSILQPFH
jgi:hypothetical protein